MNRKQTQQTLEKVVNKKFSRRGFILAAIVDLFFLNPSIISIMFIFYHIVMQQISEGFSQ